MGKRKLPIAWAPQRGPQHALVTCPIPEIFYGGARGGGKTDGVIGKYGIKALRYGKGFNAIFFRKEIPMLDDAIERSKEIYTKLGAKYTEYRKTWIFPGGGRLRFRPLERIADAEKYQGQNVSDACVEEAGNFPDPAPIDRLNGILRSVRGVPTQLILTGNPGGAGNIWLKNRYITPHPAGLKIITRDLPNGEKHKYVFIPSSIQNNRLLLKNDPGYINRLYLVGSEALVEAWLSGNWDVFEGQAFTWDRNRHVIGPIAIPPGAPIYMTFDWGFGAPFSIGWWWVDSDGRCYRFFEWYGAKDQNGVYVGLRITDDEIAEEINRIEVQDLRLPNRENIRRFAGPDCFNKKPDYKGGGQGDSTFTVFLRHGVHLRSGDPARKLKIRQMHARLRIPKDNTLPMLVVYDNCQHFIRTIPALQFDDTDPEDVDTKMEDHCLHGETLVHTDKGHVKIKDLIGTTGNVFTIGGGLTRYFNCRKVNTFDDVVRVTFDNGRSVTCTKDHKFLSTSGFWVEAKDLLDEGCHVMIAHKQKEETLCASSLSIKQLRSLAGRDIGFVDSIISAKESVYIGLYGNTTTALLARGSRFIIKIMTAVSTKLKTLNLKALLPTPHSIHANPTIQSGLSTCTMVPQSGMEVKRGLHGTKSNMKNIAERHSQRMFQRFVNFVEKITKGRSSLNFVADTASKDRGKSKTWRRSLKPVLVEPDGKAHTYCLDVEHASHAFAVCGGILVHNCYDEACHVLMARPVALIPQASTLPDNLIWPSVPRLSQIIGEEPEVDERFVNLDM